MSVQSKSMPAFITFLSTLLLGVGLWLLGARLHHPYSLWLDVLLLVAALGLWLCVCYWLWLLVMKHDQAAVTDNSEQALQRRHRVTVYLIIAVAAAFLSAYMMVPMYHWMSGGAGHVHGVVELDADNTAATLQPGQKAEFYLTQDINSDNLPVRYRLEPKVFALSSHEKQTVDIYFINPLAKPVRYRFKAKIAPGIAVPYVHYDLSDQWIDIPAQGEARIKAHIHLAPGLPLESRVVNIGHFLFSQRQSTDWKKMSRSWNQP